MLSRSIGWSQRPTRGLSLVELMVGITIGLIVVAGATLLAATQLGENRRLLQETQVQQDLRAAADIITRELRRSGYITWAPGTLWEPSSSASPPVNPLSRLSLNTGGDKVKYGYHRPSTVPINSLSFGYRLTNGAIQQRDGTGALQDLTDRNSLLITAFDVQLLQPAVSSQLACPQLCADDTQNCWPTVTISDAVVTITGHPVNNPSLRRTVTSQFRLRNEGIQLAPAATQVCP